MESVTTKLKDGNFLNSDKEIEKSVLRNFLGAFEREDPKPAIATLHRDPLCTLYLCSAYTSLSVQYKGSGMKKVEKWKGSYCIHSSTF